MGGHNAIACAAWHPDRIRGLVIVDSRPAIPAERLAQMKERGARPPRRHPTVEAAVAAFRLLPPETTRIRPCWPIWRARASRGGTGPSASGSTRRATRRACRSTAGSSSRGSPRPTLVVRGERSPILPRPMAERLRAELPGRPARRDPGRVPPSRAGPARRVRPRSSGASWTASTARAAPAAAASAPAGGLVTERRPVRSSSRPRKVYVVTAPASIRGIYETWDACRAAVSGMAGARYQGVSSRAVAEAMLSGEGLQLEPGLYAFVDGNAMGGIGVVLVEQGGVGPGVGPRARDDGLRRLRAGRDPEPRHALEDHGGDRQPPEHPRGARRPLRRPPGGPAEARR